MCTEEEDDLPFLYKLTAWFVIRSVMLFQRRDEMQFNSRTSQEMQRRCDNIFEILIPKSEGE